MPSDLASFLQPIFQELHTLEQAGMIVNTLTDHIPIKVHLAVMVTGNIPAVSKIINHSGHMSYYGCHIGNMWGTTGSNGGIYFLPSSYTNDLCTKDDYINGNPDQSITWS